MAAKRSKLSAITYMNTPQVELPAIESLDAVSLLEEMTAMHVEVPEEVWREAQFQANEGAPANMDIVVERYQGRLRVVGRLK